MMAFLVDCFCFPSQELQQKKGAVNLKSHIWSARMKLVASHEVGVYLKRLDMWAAMGGEFEPMELSSVAKVCLAPQNVRLFLND